MQSLFTKLGNIRVAIAAFVLAGGSAGLLLQPKPSAQPIAFNHKKHVDNGVGCTDCHAGAMEQARATLPPLSTCMNCHETALSSSPEEEKVRSAAGAKTDIAWRRITSVPPHVYFSHRRHTRIGGLDCSECHGQMKNASAPPTARFRQLDMNDCIRCHEQRGIKADCNDCHR